MARPSATTDFESHGHSESHQVTDATSDPGARGPFRDRGILRRGILEGEGISEKGRSTPASARRYGGVGQMANLT